MNTVHISIPLQTTLPLKFPTYLAVDSEHNLPSHERSAHVIHAANNDLDQQWADVHGVLSEMMFGFDELTLVVKGMMVGHAMATGELWETSDMIQTREVVRSVFNELCHRTNNFGFER